MRDAAAFARLQTLRKARAAGEPGFDAGEYERLRDDLVVRNLGLAHHLAAKFSDRGEPLADLVQVAALGLINAIDRYDPDREIAFSSFATPTILGEIKRYFRDKGWSIKGPRRLRELSGAIARATDELTMRTGKTPDIQEIARHLDVTPEDVIGARELAIASSVLSLDEPLHERGNETIGEGVATVDSELSGLIERLTIERALESLSGRERVVVSLRYYEGASQTEVAGRLGVSQMQVSRLQQKALARLRTQLAELPERGRSATAF
jgi:RNA polymerase sigma-B factor